jgi:hypothetical protein
MGQYKREIVAETAAALHSYGYQVYLSKTREHGFYTDGKRVVSFGGYWEFSLDFSGNYLPASFSGTYTGTGWQIATEQGVPTKEQADRWIKEGAPHRFNPHPTYTTPEQHLKTYGQSSGYTLYQPAEEAA